MAPDGTSLVRRIILAGPAGGPGIDRVRALGIRTTLNAALRRKHPEHYQARSLCMA
ncbi:hypothetical protein [Spirillospora sp. CA-128828]|uniref:hypothetical protein n=1 Tax=Spirillospora sp. CA-128828 TaxID=3240033 RepID=UPI003D908A51